MNGQGVEILSKNRIISYTVKKRTFIAAVAVALSIVALCLIKVNSAIALIAVPIIIAAAFVADKVFILVRFDIYGRDMIKRGRSPIIATCTVVSVFTAICLVSGIAGYQLALYAAKNANVVGTYENIGEAIDYLQTSGLEGGYKVTVYLNDNGKTEFKSVAVFVPKNGNADLSDFGNYKDAEEDGKGGVKVTIRSFRIEYLGEEYVYTVLNKDHLNAKIELSEGKINVVDYGQAFGLALGAAFGAVAQIAILAIVYVVGIIAAIVPSEIYFEKLIRNEAAKAE